MKKLFTALLLLVGFVSFSQSIGYFRYDSTRFEKVGGNNELILLNSTRDSIGVLYNIGNGRTRFKTISSLGLSPNVKNGIKKNVDTLLLGDSLDRYTYIQVSSHFKNNTPYTHLRLGNLPEASSLNGVVGNHPLALTYRPSLFGIETIYSTANGDVNLFQYGGNISTLFRLSRDSTDTHFGAGIAADALPGIGGEFVGQYFPPRDSTVLGIGRDGQSGNTIFGQLDIGQSWGYNLNIVPESTLPLFPLSAGRTSIDLMRVIDNTRRKKIVGAGISGFTTMYKSYQSTINMSTYEAGNSWSKIVGYAAYGDAYPFISGATKAKTLLVAAVDTAIAFEAHPQYRYTNTVRNGWGFYARGDSDRNRFNFVRIGGSVSDFNHQLEVTGDVMASDTVGGFLTGGMGLFVKIPPAIGTEAGINFAIQDTSVSQGYVYMNQPANRDFRYLALRQDAYSAAVYPENGTGFHIEFQTGANHTHLTTIWRNGNVTIGENAGIVAYRLYKKLAVDGGGVFRDTLTLKSLISKSGDTTNFKPLVVNTNGDIFQGAWNGSGGGASGVTSVAAGYGHVFTTITSTGSVVADTAVGSSNALIGWPRYNKLKDSINAVFTPMARTISNGYGITGGGDLSANRTLAVDTATTFAALRTSMSDRWAALGNAATSGSQAGWFVGTTNNVALRFGTNGTRRMYLDSARNQMILGGPTVNANDAFIFQSLTNNNYDGMRVYTLNLAGSTSYSAAGIQHAGAFDINLTSGGLSLTPTTGVIIGTSFGTPTSLLHINGSTTSRAQLRLISTGSLPTGGNILAGNIDAIGDKIYYTINTGPAQKEFTLNDAALTSGTTPVATTNGRLTDGLILAATTFTPTVAEVTNGGGVGGTTAYTCQYKREGNVVTVSGKITIDVNATSTFSEVSMTLPIASNFTAAEQAGGTACPINNNTNPLGIVANAAADKVYFTGYPSSSVGIDYSFSFTYLIN